VVSWRYLSIPTILLLAGCGSLKKSMAVGGASLAVASVTSAFSTGVSVPILAGALGASATSVIADVVVKKPKKNMALLKGEGMIECAEDNFWTALGSVVEIGGLYLILAFVIAPILIGWLLPSPTKFKGRA
jgi:hypothetical protein